MVKQLHWHITTCDGNVRSCFRGEYYVLYAELRCNYDTFIPVVTDWGRSGGVVTVAGGGMGNAS